MKLPNTLSEHWHSLLLAAAAVALILFAAQPPRAISSPEASCAEAVSQVSGASGPALGEQLQVLSWNIQKAGREGWQRDLRQLGSGVDLAFLQEASLQAPIDEALPASPHRSFALGYSTGELDTGVMTLSASTPLVECQLSVIEPWLGTPKATGITLFPLADRDEHLLTVNLHVVNFALGLQRFREQVQALGKILDDHHGPVILAGDLNTWNGWRQRLVERFSERHGLQAVQFTPDLRTRVFGRALDHVYVRGLQAESARVVEVDSSDHNPLLLNLRVL